jgi:hypothetical protein
LFRDDESLAFEAKTSRKLIASLRRLTKKGYDSIRWEEIKVDG